MTDILKKPATASAGSVTDASKGISLETVSYPIFVDRLFKEMGSVPATLIHACIGISGEISELFEAGERDNIEEELGDQCFYATKIINMHGWTWDSFKHHPTPDQRSIVVHSGRVLDLAKKMWVYEQAVDSKRFEQTFADYAASFLFLLAEYDTTLEVVQAGNVAKLLKRYPSGYTDKAAAARADKTGE